MFKIQRYDTEQESRQETGNELLTKINEHIREIKNSSEESDSQLITDKNPEENNVLHAFPEFKKSEQTQEEIATTKLLGIPNWLAHPMIIDPEFTQPIDHFSLGLSTQLIKRCKTLGIHECFAVQAAVIPILTRLKSLSEVHTSPGDICVSAPTGSGKTLAYVALVVLPTRDLVNQVKEIFEIFCKGTSLKVGTVTGQQAFVHEQEQLVGGISKVDILIATPGRLIEHISTTKNFTLQHLRFLVIDEADRLLNQSYQDWLTHILRSIQPGKSCQIKKENFGIKFDSFDTPIYDAVSSIMLENFISVPKTDISEPKTSMIQKLLFSATLTRNPAKIASLRLVNPQYISVQISDTNENEANQIKYTLPSSLKEFMIVTTSSMKPLVVLNLLHNLNISSALCFTKSVDSAHRLSKLIQLFEELYKQQNNSHSLIAVAEYSSDLSLEKRKTILNKFKRGEIKLLISSDLIARGMDLDRVDTVINYDVPVYMKKYVHRVGRTARAGRKGYAYSLIESQEIQWRLLPTKTKL
ncbi:889_t:CDS:10 [Diversispora eburnea]|uniref:ATP-dependent RNA helicase n=1 Tax=Diversispora eburnea TaxID=1213867 RepID=A0A9N9C205_9GLOM|nr:889_t:CDS:10 [Diversispora eburnea]